MKKIIATFAWIVALTSASGQAPPYTFTTIVGQAGIMNPDDGTNNNAHFAWPMGITVDTHGDLFVADEESRAIRKVTPVGTNWVVTTIAGRGEYGEADGTNGDAQFPNPCAITSDTNGNLYVGCGAGGTIRKITPVGTNWVVTTIAGMPGQAGHADGTNGTASFLSPQAIASDNAGTLYVGDWWNYTIRKVTPVGTNWVVTTIAGTIGQIGITDGINTNSKFCLMSGITADSHGNLFVTDYCVIRKLTPIGTDWVVSTIAGQAGNPGSADGTGTHCLFWQPWGLIFDNQGRFFVADCNNNLIKMGLASPNPTIALSDQKLVVSWPPNGNFGLQFSRELTPPNWNNYLDTITTNNGTNSVILVPSQSSLFFRLIK